VKILVAGEGAFGQKHLEALANIPEAEVVCLAGGVADATQATAETFKVPAWTTDLAEGLARPDVQAVILTTPTPLHAAHAEQAMRAGKSVMVEIPMADTLADCERLVRVQRETGVTAMAGHTRRFNPSHQWIHDRIKAGELNLQQMDVQTYFFRRSNMNALGKPRSWTDHLLWHHACHTVDLFQYQTGQTASVARGVEGPVHPDLNIAMDMSVQMKVPGGAICTLSLSFNNAGPLGTVFRYICDNGTYIARYDDLVDGHEQPIDLSRTAVSMNGIELQDREFISAILQRREPNASLAQCLPAMQTLDRIEKSLL
jgi:2-hydroxy-4-carboxymuconate semialdehyde hemiacetal dehydrogenase